MKYKLLFLASCSLLMTLAACGGGGGGGGGGEGATPVAAPAPAPNQSPMASFTATPSVGDAPLMVSFDGTGSTDSDGSITSYAWDYGDDSAAAGSTQSHTYSSAGTFTVTLTVTDNDDAMGVFSTSITVNAAPEPNRSPVARFTAMSTDDTPLDVIQSDGEVPLEVAFDASGSDDPDGSIASYAWDFGDGATATGSAVTNTYSSASTFYPRLTVTDDEGATDVYSASITVRERTTGTPAARFTAALPPVGTTAPFEVNFDATDTDFGGTGTAYLWRFGDGEYTAFGEQGPTQTHTYNSAGSFIADLSIFGADDGALYTRSALITVRANDNVLPVARFTASANPGADPLAMRFDASGSTDSDGSIRNYDWVLGDNVAANGGPLLHHTYRSAGTYIVHLIVTDDDSATGIYSTSIMVRARASGTQ